MKRSADAPSDGDRSHWRAMSARSGNARSRIGAREATRRRFVIVASRASNRPTTSGRQPLRSRTIFGVSRAFTSKVRSVSSTDVSSDFASTTSAIRRDRTARMSSAPPLPELGERHLQGRLPAPGFEDPRDFADHRCVSLVAKSVEPSSSPRRRDLDSRIDRRERTAQCVDGDLANVAALET